MITPSDRAYRAAKAVRLGEARIDPALDGFVERFAEEYGVYRHPGGQQGELRR